MQREFEKKWEPVVASIVNVAMMLIGGVIALFLAGIVFGFGWQIGIRLAALI